MIAFAPNRDVIIRRYTFSRPQERVQEYKRTGKSGHSSALKGFRKNLRNAVKLRFDSAAMWRFQTLQKKEGTLKTAATMHPQEKRRNFRKKVESLSLQSFRDLKIKTLDQIERRFASTEELIPDTEGFDSLGKYQSFSSERERLGSAHNLKGLFNSEEQKQEVMSVNRETPPLETLENFPDSINLNDFGELKVSFSDIDRPPPKPEDEKGCFSFESGRAVDVPVSLSMKRLDRGRNSHLRSSNSELLSGDSRRAGLRKRSLKRTTLEANLCRDAADKARRRKIAFLEERQPVSKTRSFQTSKLMLKSVSLPGHTASLPSARRAREPLDAGFESIANFRNYFPAGNFASLLQRLPRRRNGISCRLISFRNAASPSGSSFAKRKKLRKSQGPQRKPGFKSPSGFV